LKESELKNLEEFIQIPNLPKSEISVAVVDGRIDKKMEKLLNELHIKLIKTEKIDGVYEAVAYHPDIMLHHLGLNEIIAAPNINNKLLYELENNGFHIILGKSELGDKYPNNVAYNAARLGKYLICNLKYTDEILLENAYKHNLIFVNINQGYSKCSICVINENSIITSDKGIYKEVVLKGIDCCLINKGDIALKGMEYGFIGGATGLVSHNKLAFFGDISKHSDFKKVNKFLIKHKKKHLNLSENIVNDFGTLVPLKEYSILTK
jgi:hypothetical protein